MYKVRKKRGSYVAYDPKKIVNTIKAANRDTDNIASESEINVICEKVLQEVSNLLETKNVYVDEISDIVERTMMRYGCHELARKFIEYRYTKKLVRESNTTDKSIFELLNGDSAYWNDENSNKNAKLVTTQRDYMAGITSTDIARRFLLSKEVVKAHDDGYIHIHDMDYMAENTRTNCCLVNLDDMLQNGTVINGVLVEKPHRFITACTIATQIITGVSSAQYGGTTVTLTHLAPFVRDSLKKHYSFYKEIMLHEKVTEKELNKLRLNLDSNEDAYVYALAQTKKEVSDGVQTFNYQVNSMSSTNGQSPFCSVNMYLGETKEYKEELALIIEEFLNQRILGMKNERGVYITMAFPKLLYVLEEDNIKEGSKYYYLTELAAKCSAKRMVPDYISEKVMKEVKINKFNIGECYPCMGCRSFLTPDRIKGNPAKSLNYNENVGKYYGRFNVGVSTLNLGKIALASKKNEEEFWKLLDYYCELCHDGLKTRISRLELCTSDVAPILWQHGAFARLSKGERIKPLLYGGYATASLGYAGMYECVKYLKNTSHTTEDGKEFAMKVMQFINDKCAKWKKEEDIDYSVYGTPMESTTYKFAKAMKELDKDIFVKLDGKDRDFITNSFHVFVEEKIDPFDKLKLEGEFQKLSPGGVIIYIESCNLTKNIDAVLEVLKFMYNNTMYAEINMKSDYCQECGYDGEIEIVEQKGKLIYKCPNCGNTDSHKMNVARRVCGYISTNIPNQGRLDEIRNRYIHLDNHEVNE